MNIFDDEYDAFVRTPKSNYFAIAEKMLEECGLDDEHEKLIRALVIDEEINDRTNSIFIELVGNIVTQSE